MVKLINVTRKSYWNRPALDLGDPRLYVHEVLAWLVRNADWSYDDDILVENRTRFAALKNARTFRDDDYEARSKFEASMMPSARRRHEWADYEFAYVADAEPPKMRDLESAAGQRGRSVTARNEKKVENRGRSQSRSRSRGRSQSRSRSGPTKASLASKLLKSEIAWAIGQYEPKKASKITSAAKKDALVRLATLSTLQKAAQKFGNA